MRQGKRPRPSNSNSPRGVVSDEDSMALDLILSRLASLKRTIEINQFFPRSYFSQRFSVERTFDAENEEAYATLRDFTKKYAFESQEKTSWGAHTAFEVDTFQNYNAPDFKRYLNLKFGGGHLLEEESSVDTSFRMSSKSSLVSTSPTSTGIVSSANNTSKEWIAKNHRNGCSSGMRGKPTPAANHEDQTSLNGSRSSKMKSKFKAVFTFGFKKPSQTNGKATTDRTKAFLEKHNGIIPLGRPSYI